MVQKFAFSAATQSTSVTQSLVHCVVVLSAIVGLVCARMLWSADNRGSNLVIIIIIIIIIFYTPGSDPRG